ncbi:30S ribosomal protein S6e [archaeon]|jgi:small subunit ribosomal protein S6e|nr:30S ribosomal protein S6e [archaeon]
MVLKINISEKSGKTYKFESEEQLLLEKELGGKIEGSEITPDLSGYEFEITGASDKSGFTSFLNVEGIGIKKLLLTYGKGMHKKPKGEKKKGSRPKGLRKRKTVRGKIISEHTRQINLKLIKEGGKKLSEVFPEQNKAPETTPVEPKAE